ncbi:sensor histidine kinase [Anthocerotibacter panamensis]|uniref:sensor histidine kinase n=1 Tax=Anthocerotibacter panamensis TaxID=2857077 RepID=UPI001C401A9F|nr:sensor histidine kinase [Anthocerotibacter panamensis]
MYPEAIHPTNPDSFMALVGLETLAQLQQAFSEICRVPVVFTDLAHRPLLTGQQDAPFRYSVPIESNGQTVAWLAFGRSDQSPEVIQANADILRTVANLIAQQAAIAYQNKVLSQQMVHLSIGVTQAHEEERHRISRELHDEITQGLSSISLGLDLAMIDLDRDSLTYTALEQLHTQATDLTKQVRSISQDLRPPALDNFGLVPSLRQYIKRFGQQKQAPSVSFQVEGEVYRQPADLELAVFRVIQEAMNNVYKHAQAKQIMVTLSFYEERIEVSVVDDGRGFTVGDDLNFLPVEGHLGLVGMQERMAAVGGKWRVISEPGKGCLVFATCPKRSGERTLLPLEHAS